MLNGIVSKYAIPKNGRISQGSIIIPAISTAVKTSTKGTISDFIAKFLKENRGIRLTIKKPISAIYGATKWYEKVFGSQISKVKIKGIKEMLAAEGIGRPVK